ncbi:SGNH/GDSL hydrolase family protein [Ruminococcus sp.]|uniref:SGNH/GDSL hydrolase family protein n=1 Tax=Ruminococcus sp. TaxID=41978 RepID=UPI0025CD86EB|nr:SGNH/GDSL hydrolase family protein [Ruminococcus sp.]MCR4638841.1 SGNH/GDSL hydrolase family protein [Ruminococcus sp.]
MKDKIIGLLKSPVLAMLLFLSVILTFSLTSSFGQNENSETAGAFAVAAVDAAADIVNDELTTCPVTACTTTSTTTTVTTAITTTTSPYEVLQPDRYAGTSPNSAFYQERLAVAGDSLALGFCYYGFVPKMHSIAGDSVSMWNLDYFTFDHGNGELGLVDSITEVRPRLLYISVGMNDINMNNPENYVKRYREVIDEIIRRMPEINIVVAAITPVCSYCTVVKNSIIREYNTALEKMVKDIDSEQVIYFDAYSVVSDKEQNLREDYTSGDGMHIYIPCYNDILTALFDFLDTTELKKRLDG